MVRLLVAVVLAFASLARADGVRVSLRASGPGVGLYRLEGGVDRALTGEWQAWLARDLVCRAPCDTVTVPGLYQIRGPGLVESDRFRLDAASVRLDVSPGSRIGRAFAIVSLIAGVAGLAAGGALLFTSADLDGRYRDSRNTLPTDFDPSVIPQYRRLGTGFLVGGGVAFAGGVIGILLTRTRVALSW